MTFIPIKNRQIIVSIFIIALSLMISVVVLADVYPENIGAIVLTIIFGIIGVFGVFLAKRLLHLRWQDIFLVGYVILFAVSELGIGRISLGGINFRIYIFVMPILGIIWLAKQPSLLTIRVSRYLRYETLFLGLMLFLVFLSVVMSSDGVNNIAGVVELGAFIFGYLVFAGLVDSRCLWLQLMWIFIITETVILAYSLFRIGGIANAMHRLVAYGTPANNTNQYAFLLETILLIFLGLFLTKKGLKGVILATLGVMFFGFGLAMTFSRSAFLSASVALTVFFLISFRRIKWSRAVLLVVVGGSIVLLLLPSVWLRTRNLWSREAYYDPAIDRIVATGAESNRSRLMIWRTYLHEAIQYPVFGIGYGNQLEFDLPLSQRRETRSAHNSYLDLMASSGIPAFVMMGIFLALHGFLLWRIRREFNQPDVWGNILVIFFVAMLVQMLVQIFFVGYYFWGLLGFQGAAINIYATTLKKRYYFDNVEMPSDVHNNCVVS